MSKQDQEEITASGYPNGHLYHLTPDQDKALEEFKDISQKAGYYHAATHDTKASHGEETLLRFLRARNFVPSAAFQQFKDTEEWRKEQDIEKWYDTIDVDEYEETRLLYTQWTGRRDKLGLPLYVLDISKLDPGKLSQYEAPIPAYGKVTPKLRRLFATCEHLTDFVMPLCSAILSRPYPETPISQTTCIVDISGLGLRQFWKLKAHLQDASTLATAHYPETLGRTFIIGAPSFFPTLWGWVKRWFDPGTVAKIFVLPQSEVSATLSKHIEHCDIPKRYGGSLDWDFGQLPNLDPRILEVITLEEGATTIPKGPLRWRENVEGGRVDAHALGTESGNQRDRIIARSSSEPVSKALAARIY